ncbi:hypothetical protein HTZ77_03220 [Nonomuraea sp. SMC257]|uniref:Uncharacterized protein n=1 Tax=Nonomuraea montanisoli TaxID=2741721 RepID=A0A7Y6M1S6_9ACTN|nr:hypothetical protein [Nonomuraea montanisoli]NUW30439.1 hypothetical protein [Nonomuraea montanisoli]
MIGALGCSAQADSGPTPTPTATATATTTATSTATTTATAPARASIKVELNPDRVTAGETSRVWILANCPVPTGGPAHTGTATSRAFINGVPLNPAAPTPGPNATSTPSPGPWVRGEAQVSGTVARGSYRVDVKCDGTNDTGRATLRVVRADPLPSDVPTRAPRAGGGGTFGKDVDDDSGLPLAPAGIVLGLVLAAGVGIAVKRRSRA